MADFRVSLGVLAMISGFMRAMILGSVVCSGSCVAAAVKGTGSGGVVEELKGRVVDPSGAAVAGAEVEAQCGPYRSEVKSGAEGRFVLTLRQSTCTVAVRAPGFATFQRVVDATENGAEGITLQLQVASVSGEVTVTARQDAVDVAKIGADPMDLPLAVESVPIALVQEQGFTRLVDVVRNVSGVVSKEAYFGVTDTFNVRGFDASSSLFNGFRRDYYGTVNDLASVERVEVIKGPSSVTEGFLEPGGIINVVTKRPYGELGSNFSLMTGTFGTVRGQGDVNVPLAKNVFLRGTGALEHRASWRDYVSDNISHGGLAMDWSPSPSTLLESRFYNTYLTGVPDRGLALYTAPAISFEQLLALPVGSFFGDPDDQYKQRNTNLSEMVRQGLGESWSFRTGVNFFQLADLRKNVEVDGADATYPTLLDREYTVVYGNSSTVNAVAEFSGEGTTFKVRHHITGGVDYQRLFTYYNFTENFNLPLFDPFQPNYGGYARVQGPSTGLFNGYTYDTGTYAQDLMSLGRHIRVLLGARQDQFNYHDGDVVADYTTRLKQGAFSPQVGLVYQPVSTISVYGNYATSFDPQQGVVLLSGASPTPSRGRQVEVGVKYNDGGRLAMSADVFRIRKTNVATGVPGNPDYAQLTGEEESTGAEFDGTFRVRKGMSLRGNIADTRAIVSADTSIPVGDRLLNVPRLQGALWLGTDVPHTKLHADFGWFGVGQREAELPNKDSATGVNYLIPKYNRFDAALLYELRPGLTLQANLQNFSNVKYYTSQDYLLYPGAPVNAEFTLKWTPERKR
jgi:iron complex outermembrane receptor protein